MGLFKTYRLNLLFSLGMIMGLASRQPIQAQEGAANPLHKKELGTLKPNVPVGIGTPGKNDSGEDEEELTEERPEAGRGGKHRTPAPAEVGRACPAATLDAFVQISSHSRPQVAPDGTLYFISDMREAPQVFSLSKPLGWPEQMTFFPDGVRYFALSPDGTKLLVASDEQGNEQFDLYLLESKTRRLTPLLQGGDKRIESVVWAGTSDWFAYSSNVRNRIDFDLYRFDLKSAKSELLSELSGLNIVSDISPNGQQIAVVEYKSVTDSRIWLYQNSPLTGKELASTESPRPSLSPLLPAAKGPAAELDPHFSKDSQSVLYLSDRDRDLHQLWAVSLKNGTTKVLTSEEHPVESVSLDSGRGLLVYTVNRSGQTGWGGFEIDGTGQKRRLLLLPTDKTQVNSGYAISRRQGKTQLFFGASSPKQPANIYEWSHPKTTVWTRAITGGIDESCFSVAQRVEYPSFDGEKIPGFVYLPKNASLPVPFLVYVHGGPESQFRPGFNKTFQYFLSRGFGIFVPNVRGSTGYGRRYTMLDDYKRRIDSVQDVTHGAQWLVQNEFSLPLRMGIFGGSYGGFLVLRAIELEPELFGAASESVGISNFVTFLKNTKPYRRALREAEYGPLSDETFLRSISPETHAERIKTPLQMFHGANDPRVPVGETEQLSANLKRRGIPVEVRIFSDEGHGNTKLKNILEQTKLTAYFFEKHLQKSTGK